MSHFSQVVKEDCPNRISNGSCISRAAWFKDQSIGSNLSVPNTARYIPNSSPASTPHPKDYLPSGLKSREGQRSRRMVTHM